MFRTDRATRTDATAADPIVRHRWIEVDDVKIFYRECGPADAPVLLLPHGCPASSYAFRRLLPALGDHWRAIAPDLPGFGYSDTPAPSGFSYTFDGCSQFLQRFTEVAELDHYVIHLHDYGSEFGFRLAMAAPDRVPPDLWSLSWAQLGTPRRRENLTALLADQRHTVSWFARQQAYLRTHRPANP